MQFETLNVPGPIPTPVTSPFWDALSAGRFELQLCKNCAKRVFYPRALCPHCWSEDLVWAPAQPKGTLATFTEVHRPGHPAWEALAPYVLGIVHLADGPQMLSHILLESQEAAYVGMALEMRPTRIGQFTLPFFAPVK